MADGATGRLAPELSLVYPDAQGKPCVYAIPAGTTTIGSASDNDLVLAGAAAHQVVLTREGDRLELRDLFSGETKVNDSARRSGLLLAGDVLSLGAVKLRVMRVARRTTGTFQRGLEQSGPGSGGMKRPQQTTSLSRPPGTPSIHVSDPPSGRVPAQESQPAQRPTQALDARRAAGSVMHEPPTSHEQPTSSGQRPTTALGGPRHSTASFPRPGDGARPITASFGRAAQDATGSGRRPTSAHRDTSSGAFRRPGASSSNGVRPTRALDAEWSELSTPRDDDPPRTSAGSRGGTGMRASDSGRARAERPTSREGPPVDAPVAAARPAVEPPTDTGRPGAPGARGTQSLRAIAAQEAAAPLPVSEREARREKVIARARQLSDEMLIEDDFEVILERVALGFLDIFSADRAVTVLFEEDGRNPLLTVERRRDGTDEGAGVAQEIVDRCLQVRSVIRIAGGHQGLGGLAAPLIGKGKALGLLYFERTTAAGQPFDAIDVHIMAMLTNQAAVVIAPLVG